MDELRRAMLDAGAPPDEWQAELPFLIETGQKRVRRRRMIATGVAAAVVTVIGTTAALMGVPGLNKSDPDPVKELPSGLYVEERISPAEVDRRCTIAVNNADATDQTWVAGVDKDGRAVPAAESVKAVENRVGYSIQVAVPGTRFPTKSSADGGTGASFDAVDGKAMYCTIPQARMIATAERPPSHSLPSLDDGRQIADRCSRYGGYDVRGWDLLAAAESDAVDAIFLSTNGYVLTCDIWRYSVEIEVDGRRVADDEGEPILPADDTGPKDPDRYSGLEVICSEGRPAECSGSGVLPGLPDGYQIEFTLPDGSRHRTETNRGGYAIGIEDPEGFDGAPPIIGIRVLAPDGVLVWKDKKTVPRGGGGVGGDGDGTGSGVVPSPVPPALP